MGEVNGIKGAWGHVKGGMGAVSQAIQSAAIEAGADVHVNTPVKSIAVSDGKARGVCLESGDVVESDCIVSNASPVTTMLDLLGKEHLSKEVLTHFKRNWNSESASTKVRLRCCCSDRCLLLQFYHRFPFSTWIDQCGA
jgi:phytoene dehydrogenase-like protein